MKELPNITTISLEYHSCVTKVIRPIIANSDLGYGMCTFGAKRAIFVQKSAFGAELELLKCEASDSLGCALSLGCINKQRARASQKSVLGPHT